MFIPTIAKHDYEAFRRILNLHLPDTYDEWFYLTNKRSLENEAMGNTSQPVEVHPDEFSRYCRAMKATADRHGLDSFAYEKGMGHKY